MNTKSKAGAGNAAERGGKTSLLLVSVAVEGLRLEPEVPVFALPPVLVLTSALRSQWSCVTLENKTMIVFFEFVVK